jgi:hypothetical protein
MGSIKHILYSRDSTVVAHKVENVTSVLVHPPAVLPDLPTGPCQRGNIPHLDHSHHEVLEEGFLAADV